VLSIRLVPVRYESACANVAGGGVDVGGADYRLAKRLKVANARVALAEAPDLQALLETSRAPEQLTDLYAETAPLPLFEDGYEDDWQALKSSRISLRYSDHKSTPARAAGGSIATYQMRLARRDNRLFVFIDVNDDDVIYHLPPVLRTNMGEGELPDRQIQLVNGDALELFVHAPETAPQHVLFRTIAPGPLTGLVASDGEAARAGQVRTGADGQFVSLAAVDTFGQAMRDYRGVWVANEHGYQLEVTMPLPPIGSVFGVALIDVDTQGGSREAWIGTLDPRRMRASRRGGDNMEGTGRLYHAANVAISRLSPWVTPGVRARLFDRRGRLLADVNSLYDKTEELSALDPELDPERGSIFNALLFRLFSYFVSADSTENNQPYTVRDSLHLSVETTRRAEQGVSDTRGARYSVANWW